MNSFSLLSPSMKKFKRIAFDRNPYISGLIIFGGLVICVGIYFALLKFLGYVNVAPMLGKILGPVIGALLVSKLLEMLFLSLFFMILFSCIISALSSFYLNEELQLLIVSPQSITSIFFSRFITMTFESSWMVLIFFTPAFYAFATILKASYVAYFVFPLFLGIFIIIPNLMGAFFALSLATFFPVRQMKKVFQFLSIIMLTVLVFFLRSLQAEKLINPSYFKDVSQYILGLKNPLLEYSPSFWFHKASVLLFKAEYKEAFVVILPITGIIIVSFILLNIFAKKLYLKSWQISMEAVNNQVLGLEWLRSILIYPFRFFSSPTRVIATKEITFFLRDPAFFSQIFMMTAIVFVYGYNLTILPLKDLSTLYSGEINDTLVYMNGPFIGFILAAIAMRFVFPSISMEGRAFWAMKASPLSARRIVVSKYFLYLLPMLFCGLVLCAVTNSLFAVTTKWLMWVSYVNVILQTVVITALAIGLGTLYASFEANSPLKIAGSYGGMVYMMLCAAFAFNLLFIEAYPVFRYFFRHIYLVNSSISVWVNSICAIVLVICSVGWVIMPLRKGMEEIERYEPE